jgi:NADP-dependent 3-hydroxy acid dehydrogenase YdfG
VLVAGASSGLGYAFAKYVLEKGDRVAMGARTLTAMSDLAALLVSCEPLVGVSSRTSSPHCRMRVNHGSRTGRQGR